MKVRAYLADAFDGMAKGLFASLIIGTILAQVGAAVNLPWLITVGNFAKTVMGGAIGAGVAYKLGAGPFTLMAAIAAGFIGAWGVNPEAAIALGRPGEPAGALIVAMAATEAGRLVEGRTKFDLLITPAVVILVAGAVGTFLSPLIAALMREIGAAVNAFTALHPLPMGVLVAVCVGLALTGPISSAALCIAIGIDGLAAGAALAGCCAQMVGFAVSSYRDNKVGGLLTQGLGTSKIQLPNVIRNPWILLPPTLAAAVCGGLAPTAFHMRTDMVGAGMGTSGLVGQITTLAVMGANLGTLSAVVVLHLLIPAALALGMAEGLRRLGKIKAGDMRL